jgi:ubiquinone/menaquinone biosynthesis C-methylase UbiE
VTTRSDDFQATTAGTPLGAPAGEVAGVADALPPRSVPGADTPASAVARHQKRRWSKAVDGWDHHGVVGLGRIIAAVVSAATSDGPLDMAVDIGAGTGAIAIPLAPQARRVVAVDVSQTMLERLAQRAEAEGVGNVEVLTRSIEELSFPPGSVDLVVSNYALHHLLDRDKALFVERAATWLRPGGRLVIGDMMIGRGTSAEDRKILAGKVQSLIGRGPGGWWRIAKNAWRLLLRVSERPVSPDVWVSLLRKHGFVDITAERIVAEAALVTGRRPPKP